MSAIDTIYLLNDTIVAKLNLVNSKIPDVVENISNANGDQSWIIAIIVCFTVIAVTCIVTNCITEWHSNANNKNGTNGGGSGEPSQETQIDKDKREYTSKLISFREELSKKDSKLKDFTDQSCKDYIKLLTDLAKKGKVE